MIIFLFSCSKKEDATPSTAEIQTGTLRFHLHTYLEETEVDGYNIVYTTSSGRKISLSKAQLYLSNFELIKSDGSTFLVPDSIVWQVRENETYVIGKVPIGNYKGIRFHVGLDHATNLLTPSLSSTDPLNQSSMWFGSSAQPDGYVFLNLEGKIDTTSAANSSEADMKPFKYLIGTDASYTQVIMPAKDYTIVADQTQFLHLYTNYYKLFDGIAINQEANLQMTTVSANNSALGTKLRNNLSHLFVFEE